MSRFDIELTRIICCKRAQCLRLSQRRRWASCKALNLGVCTDMTQGERIILKLHPEYSYAQKGCKFKPPKGYPPDADFVFDLQLANVYPGPGVKVRSSFVRT